MEVITPAPAPVETAPATPAAQVTPAAPETPAAPAAPAAPATPAAQVAPATPAPGNWIDSLPQDRKDFVANKGFTGPEALLESYINLEKLRGVPAENLFAIPASKDAPEWEHIHAKLGKPEDPSGYAFKKEEGKDNAFLDWAEKAFHENNIPRAAAEGIIDSYTKFAGEYTEGQKASENEAYVAKLNGETAKLKTDWGQAYDVNVGKARNAAQAFGIDADTIDGIEKAMGYAKTMELFHTIGSRMGEDNFVNGHKTMGGLLTPEQAVSRIGALKQDRDFVQRYQNGDTSAAKEMEDLHKMAYPTKA